MPALNVPSPLGLLTVVEEAGAIVALDWNDAPDGVSGGLADNAPTTLLTEAARQLTAYFDGALTAFDLPLAPAGSAFRKRVWQAMADIPYGETRTYGDLARSAGSVSGTTCSRLAFIREAAMVHRPDSRSISSHVAPRTSPDLAAVRIANASARRLNDSRLRSCFRKTATLS